MYAIGDERGHSIRFIILLRTQPFDNTLTISRLDLGRQIGWLLDDQEPHLARAISYAFDLKLPDDL